MIIYIKMDLALNNLQRLICHKIQPTVFLWMYWSIYSSSPVPLVPLWHPFCLTENSPGFMCESYFSSLIFVVSIFQIIGRHDLGLLLLGVVSFLGTFWLRVVLLSSIRVCQFLIRTIHFDSHSVKDRSEFF